MKLKMAKRICWGLVILFGAAFVALYALPDSMKQGALAVVIALMTVMAIFNMAFLRCPDCRAHVHLWGMKYCPRCGTALEEE